MTDGAGLIKLLTLEPLETNLFRGQSEDIGSPQVFGGQVIRANTLMHGKTSPVFHQQKSLFKGLPNPLTATRYHSLIINKKNLPACLEITAETEDGIIMGLKHKDFPVHGVQFHPESILTASGKQILKNFLEM